ncbi:B12-binding domain-containing radical SAM protein [Thermoplasma sp. Kam2015]|uniref:B12-binding domain-containing radical SAM protein n=1 Tax=Thermoplasma sp. Kam2015 TaxID=2094122 RepID=UPI000D9BFB1C|nr:radical SAM protein [Thermoplasma sp. Kam2015]PYB69059.1 B12-binding domain-containing radical SAM protein [Thermoplasma sp. Kam2015]
MKILLLSPPTDSVIKSVIGTTGPPLGLAYLASVARDQGEEVKIIDSIAMEYSHGDVKNQIKTYDPDFIGITSTTSMIPDVYNIARFAKMHNNEVKIAVGGPHVTFTPDITLEESPDIDYVVIGEGELIFSNLLQHLEGKKDIKKIKGIAYRSSEKIVITPPEDLIKDIDTIPMPAIDLLPMDRYMAGKKRFGTIMTSRGCPYNCIFCSSSLQFGKKWRAHSTERVMAELRRLVNDYGLHEIEFLDDTFTLNMKRASEIAQKIKEEKLDIHWSASARVNLFNSEIARAMKEAGAHTIYFGIESGNQKTLDFIGKGITLQQAVDSVRKGNEAGLNTLGSFIIGFPDDTREDVRNTIRFAKKVRVLLAQFTIATPYPGTRLWHLAKTRGIIKTLDWRKYTTLNPVMKLTNFTDSEILRWLGKAYVSFYLRPSYLLHDLIKDHGFVFKRIIPYYSKAITAFKHDRALTDGHTKTTS